MPMPGEINSPVCWVNASGQVPLYAPGPMRMVSVGSWQRPWQTPTGVMLENKTTPGTIQIQVAGEFRVPLADVYPHMGADVPDTRSLAGQRVYYDPTQGAYIVVDVPVESPTEDTPAALYPGSATIGYISDVTDEEVGITIDPRPPTATYDVCLASTADDDWLQGTPVTIDPATRIITPCTSSSTRFDGVAVWWLNPLGSTPQPYEPMIVVTRGPTWYQLDADKLYNITIREELFIAPPTLIPIDITGAAVSVENPDENIVMGTITLEHWYQELPTFGLLNVNPPIPTVTETNTVLL